MTARFSVRAQWRLEVYRPPRPHPSASTPKRGTRCRQMAESAILLQFLQVMNPFYRFSLGNFCSPASNLFQKTRGWKQRKVWICHRLRCCSVAQKGNILEDPDLITARPLQKLPNLSHTLTNYSHMHSGVRRLVLGSNGTLATCFARCRGCRSRYLTIIWAV